MNQEQIKSLIDALAASDLCELEYVENGCTLRLSKAPRVQSASAAAPAPERGPAPIALEPRSDEAEAASQPRPAECLAPLYGVVHLHPSPGEPAFVVPGQQVVAGQTLCVIEAMKVFNEVRADADLRLLSVLVQTGQEVESGQPLFVFG
jgi:acetyl-CoA carboxylase biotin carboxyl carrier protein